MPTSFDARRLAPATARNREPILAVLRRVLPRHGAVLELSSGTGEHAVHFARAFPDLVWQPTDFDPGALASIAAHRADAGLANLLPPLCLDAAAAEWPMRQADAIVCINMIHIAPWAACVGLMAGAERSLRPGGVLYLYGPYKVDGRHTADSNRAFDEDLRVRDAAWGVRDLGAVRAVAADHGLAFSETIAMPANNFSVIFRRVAVN